ncbi:MAG: nucleotide sugar dehydrogenase [Planctomycetes bacterium]|nr:nucleotide sugar dehydrogenase [Planctomycetota bacterium]
MPAAAPPSSELLAQFREKARSGRLSVAVAGLGYVGLPMALRCARALNRVVGIDLDPARVASIRKGISYIDDVSDAQMREQVEAAHFTATTDYEAVRPSDVVLICVPTPLRKTGEPDLSFIVRSVEAIEAHMSPGKLVVLESTSYPGTTEELVRPRLERGGMRAGRDFYLAFSPERIDPGPKHQDYGIRKVPKVVGGVTPNCTEAAAEFYRLIVDQVVAVSSSRVAEMVKLLENTYRSVNIAMVNELALMCQQLGVDVWEVVDAAKTKPYGFEAFYPGPGLGGHCIPVDPFYLAWKARLLGFEPRFIDLAGRINSSMPHYIVNRLTDLLNDAGRPVRDSRVHILGVTYKPDVSDLRESPALTIIDLLRRKGARITFSDPHVSALTLPDGTRLDGAPLEQGALAECDCALIVTDHSAFDWDYVVREAPLILDSRNALKNYNEDHIHKL